MEEFLKVARNNLDIFKKISKVKVVLGNRSADLDSVVCALVYGFFLHKEVESQGSTDVAVIPVLNVPKNEFRLKTEVRHYLGTCQIPLELLTFRDEVKLDSLQDEKKLELILVDHHVLTEDDANLANSVIEVVDHRPLDNSWSWEGLEKKTIEAVGSCASLIAQKMFKRPDIMDQVVCKLLRGPILIDTCNLSKEANRAKPLDHEMIGKLESLAKIESDREEIFQNILQAKSDISQLTAQDLLLKDLKIINNVAVPGFPILVKSFVNNPKALESIEDFSEKYGLVVLLGMEIRPNIIKDMGIYSREKEIAEKLIPELNSIDLELKEIQRFELKKGTLVIYQQGNVKLSRKQILPIVQNALEK